MTSFNQTLIKLVEIEGKGKGYVASQPLKGGQIILQESPILIFSAFPLKHHQQKDGVSSTNTCSYCAQCFRKLSSKGGLLFLSCPTCSHPNDTIFCSSNCESLAMCTTHTSWVCQSLNQLRDCSLLWDHQCEDLQVQARYLVAAYNLAINSPSNFDKLLSLHENDAKDMKTAKILHSIISLLQFPEGFVGPSVELIASLLNKESCNSFTLMEPFLESGKRSARAYGMYYNASFFNHDCLPNACRFDYIDRENVEEYDSVKNTDIIVRMIHDVPQGEEICMSYFRVGLSYDERKKKLMDYFGFVCFCDRCKVETRSVNEKYVIDEIIEHESYDSSVNNDGRLTTATCHYPNVRSFHHLQGLNSDHKAKFFERYMCERENCGGTLAPLQPFSGNEMEVMECNFCGNLKNKMY